MKTKTDVLNYLKNNVKTPRPGQAVNTEFFRPEDAMGVVSICYAVYGEGYPVDTYYIPEKLIEENRKGNIHSVVARNADGDVVGHGALFHSSSPFSGMYEAGQYIIHKSYRGSGAVQEINRYVTTLCPEKYDIDVMYGEPVTNHTIIQKMGQLDGFIETALEIDLMPAQAYEAEKSAQGRVSTLLSFKIRKDHPHTIYLPAAYQERICQDIAELSLDRVVGPGQSGMPGSGKTKIIPEFFDFAGVGRLQVTCTGEDIYQAIQEFEDEIQKKEFQVAQLFLPLDQAGTDTLCTHLNGRRYFYGGYLPRWFGTDAILMQKVLPRPCFEGLKLYSDKAKQLLDYVRKDWGRIA